MSTISFRQLISSNERKLHANVIQHEIKTRSRREDVDDAEVGWSVINEEVDTVIPLLLQHLQKLGIEHLQLPDIKENLSVVSKAS